VNIDDALAALDTRQSVNGSREVRYCDCAETLVNGKRVPAPAFHDCQYVRCRSALVKTAEKTANELVGTDNGGGHWTRVFSDMMEELAKRCL
jgi:hypothetical protein